MRGQRFLPGFFLIAVRQVFRLRHPEFEQLADDALGIVLFGVEGRAEIEILVEKFLGAASFLFYLGAERRQPLRAGAHIFQIANVRRL